MMLYVYRKKISEDGLNIAKFCSDESIRIIIP